MDTYGVASLCKGYQGQIHLQSSSGVFFLPKWFPLFDRGYVFNHLDVCLGSTVQEPLVTLRGEDAQHFQTFYLLCSWRVHY